MRALALITLIVACSVTAASQQTRAQEIAASFTKFKHETKEKYGFRKEKYKDVKSEPAVKQNTRDYAGVYEVPDLGYVINIQVGSDGAVRASGFEKAPQSRTFTLENARIEGALLTATTVYGDGATERFEGAFLSRTDRDSPTDPGVTIFGLGVVLNTPTEINGITYERLFYQRRQ